MALIIVSNASADSRPRGSDYHHPISSGLVRFDGRIIDSIEIENRQIFDTQKEPYNNVVFRTANKLHIKTRKSVLARELLLDKGDRFSSELAEEIARNLRNRYIVYDAWIEVDSLTANTVLMRIVTIDEWSFTGGFDITREGNEYLYQLGFEEKNFLGFNQLLSLDYYIQEKDANYFASSFRDYRLMGKPYRLSLDYSGNPKSKVEAVTFGHPFYSLAQKYSYSFQVAKGSSRHEIFNDSHLIGQSRTKSDLFGSALSRRFGQRFKNIVTGINYSYNFERTDDKKVLSYLGSDTVVAEASFPMDSLYHEVGLQLRGFLVNFTTFRKIDGFGYTEDFTLGHTAAVGYSRAFDSHFDVQVYDKVFFDYSFGYSFANELFYASYIRINKFRGVTDFEKITNWLFNYYHRGPEFLTVAFRAKYIRDWRYEGTEGLILGGTSGLRGYRTEFRTGNRMAVATLEGRFHPEIRLLSTLLGFALFADAGRTYKQDEDFTLNGFYFSGGLGLRFALDRSSKSRFFRLDLAYSKENSWQISLSTGQYFSYSEHRLFLTSR